jgi:3-isopropylmalate dehydrogenase
LQYQTDKNIQYIIALFPLKREIVEGIDFIIFRELTGGIYFAEKKLNEDENKASDYVNIQNTK